ncbi:hypothetical protein KJ656_07625 [bacterium]|nr:hypothetical protein [bacterium]
MPTGEKLTKTEVSPRISRRYLTRAHKLEILQEYDSCIRVGEKGELLRREGLYSSSITD